MERACRECKPKRAVRWCSKRNKCWSVGRTSAASVIFSKLNAFRNSDVLLTGAYFNATAVELASAGVPLESAVKASGGGYLASLGVYHEMHCIVCYTFTLKHGTIRTDWQRINSAISFTANLISLTGTKASLHIGWGISVRIQASTEQHRFFGLTDNRSLYRDDTSFVNLFKRYAAIHLFLAK
jgi:hypothetical protein